MAFIFRDASWEEPALTNSVCFRISLLGEAPKEPRGWKRTRASRVSQHHTTRSIVFSRPLQFRTSHLTKSLEQAMSNNQSKSNEFLTLSAGPRSFHSRKKRSKNISGNGNCVALIFLRLGFPAQPRSFHSRKKRSKNISGNGNCVTLIFRRLEFPARLFDKNVTMQKYCVSR